MPRGGHNKPTWNAGKTTIIRVPESKKLYILALLRTLDELDWNCVILDKDFYDNAMAILTETLTIPKNRGRAYHSAILEVLALLGKDPDTD